MADKSTFTSDEWKTLLESVMATTLAVTAAEPSGLWGLLKESFASGTILAKAKMDTGSNSLIKAVVDDFATSEGRAASRDGLQEKLSGKKAADVKTACMQIIGKLMAFLVQKLRATPLLSRTGCARSAKVLPRRQPKVAFWALAVLR